MKTFTIGQVCSKEVFVDVNGKNWMVSGFSDKDDNNKDWYNIYDEETVQTGKDWIPYFKMNDTSVEMVAMFDVDSVFHNESNIRPMLTLENLYNQLIQLKFQRY